MLMSISTIYASSKAETLGTYDTDKTSNKKQVPFDEVTNTSCVQSMTKKTCYYQLLTLSSIRGLAISFTLTYPADSLFRHRAEAFLS